VPEHLYGNIEYADGSKEAKDHKTIEREAAAREDIVEPPKDEVAESPRKAERKKGIFGKINLPKV
jgi:hypothetical protein